MFALRPTATGEAHFGDPGSTALFNLVFGAAKFTAATAAAHRTTWKQLRAKILNPSPVDSKNATTNPLSIGAPLKVSKGPGSPFGLVGLVQRGEDEKWPVFGGLARPRHARSRPRPAWRGGGNKASSGLVVGVTDLVQRGADMKSGLARPLENYFCLMGSTSKTPAPPQKTCKLD